MAVPANKMFEELKINVMRPGNLIEYFLSGGDAPNNPINIVRNLNKDEFQELIYVLAKYRNKEEVLKLISRLRSLGLFDVPLSSRPSFDMHVSPMQANPDVGWYGGNNLPLVPLMPPMQANDPGTALHFAVTRRSADEESKDFRELIENILDIARYIHPGLVRLDRVDGQHKTVVHVAIDKRDEDAMEIFIKLRIDLNPAPNVHYPLSGPYVQYAMRLGTPSMVSRLIAAGADANYVTCAAIHYPTRSTLTDYLQRGGNPTLPLAQQRPLVQALLNSGKVDLTRQEWPGGPTALDMVNWDISNAPGIFQSPDAEYTLLARQAWLSIGKSVQTAVEKAIFKQWFQIRVALQTGLIKAAMKIRPEDRAISASDLVDKICGFLLPPKHKPAPADAELSDAAVAAAAPAVGAMPMPAPAAAASMPCSGPCCVIPMPDPYGFATSPPACQIVSDATAQILCLRTTKEDKKRNAERQAFLLRAVDKVLGVRTEIVLDASGQPTCLLTFSTGAAVASSSASYSSSSSSLSISSSSSACSLSSLSSSSSSVPCTSSTSSAPSSHVTNTALSPATCRS